MKFRFSIFTTTENYAEIEADSYEEAVKKLEEEDPVFMDGDSYEDTKCVDENDVDYGWGY